MKRATMHRKMALLVWLLLNIFLVAADAATFPAPSLWIINPEASTSSDNGPLPSDKTFRIITFSTAEIAVTERFTDQAGNCSRNWMERSAWSSAASQGDDGRIRVYQRQWFISFRAAGRDSRARHLYFVRKRARLNRYIHGDIEGRLTYPCKRRV